MHNSRTLNGAFSGKPWHAFTSRVTQMTNRRTRSLQFSTWTNLTALRKRIYNFARCRISIATEKLHNFWRRVPAQTHFCDDRFEFLRRWQFKPVIFTPRFESATSASKIKYENDIRASDLNVRPFAASIYYIAVAFCKWYTWPWFSIVSLSLSFKRQMSTLPMNPRIWPQPSVIAVIKSKVMIISIVTRCGCAYYGGIALVWLVTYKWYTADSILLKLHWVEIRL